MSLSIFGIFNTINITYRKKTMHCTKQQDEKAVMFFCGSGKITDEDRRKIAEYIRERELKKDYKQEELPF